MARKLKAAEVNEIANREVLSARSLQAKLILFRTEFIISEDKRRAAEKEYERLHSEIETLKAATLPVTTVVGISALSRCLGYHGSLILSFVHDGMPHRMEDGTAVFHLPTVHRWVLDRREQHALADRRADVVEQVECLKSEIAGLQTLVHNQVLKIERLTLVCPDPDAMYALADIVVEVIEFVTDMIDDTLSSCSVPGTPEAILRDEDNAIQLVGLVDLARRLRAAHADIPLGLAEPSSILEAR